MTSFVSISFPSALRIARNTDFSNKCPPRRSRQLIRSCASAAENGTIPLPITADAIEQTAFDDEDLDDSPFSVASDSGDSFESEDAGGSWYAISERISKADSGSSTASRPPTTSDGAVDLLALEGMGREVLAGASYDAVVDIDIEDGGVLAEDDDNNDLFCGVGLDALIESDRLLENLQEGLNIHTATHVQLAAIPRVLDRRDMVIQSHTGTGKTLAFLLPLLDNVEQERPQVQGVIVAPTRELAMQIARECERLCEGTEIRTLPLIGGANPARQVEKLRKKQPHIVVGTPGRIAELHDNRELHLRGVDMLVVDEVDQCVQGAFAEDIIYLLRAVPPRTQKILVSATSDVDTVRAFAGENLHKPVLLRVGGSQRLPKNIQHFCCVVPARMRIELLRKLMNVSPVPTRAIVFVDDPRRVDMVVERLYQMKVAAAGLRGNAHKLERAEVLTAFRKGRVSLLVTTEVAARGLDIPEISHVFNLDLPTDGDHYVHRAGRCGRVRNAGTVVSIATGETAFVIGRLSKELGVEIKRMEPRGGEYGEVIERRSEGRSSRDRGTRAQSAGRTAPAPEARGHHMKSTRSARVPTETSGFESSNVVDERTTRQEPGRRVGGERGVFSSPREKVFTDAPRIGPELKKTSKTPAKSKAKLKAENKLQEDAVGKRKVLREKRRLEKTKDKGKPKGKVGKSAVEEHSARLDDGENTHPLAGRASTASTDVHPKGRANGVRRERNLGSRAKSEGWVGNR